MMIKVIAFDFGGVIYRYNHEILMKAIARKIVRPLKEVSAAWKIKIAAYELGQISEDEFWDCFLRKLSINFDSNILHQIVVNHFKPIPGALNILADIKNTAIIGLISNQTSWIDDLEIIYGFKRLFKILVISKDVALRKPSKEIFILFIQKAGVKPEEIIFIDDNADYKKAVEDVGINFIHFRNPEQLKRDLKKLYVKL